MPVTVAEKLTSRSYEQGDNPSAELLYWAEGSTDEAEIVSAVAEAAPTTFHGLWRSSIRVDPVTETHWDASVRYASPAKSGSPELSEVGSFRFSWRTKGATKHITHAISHIGDYSTPDRIARNHYGAINVTADGVQGLDVSDGQWSWQETHVISDDMWTAARKRRTYMLTYRVNSGYFRGFAPGEVLFEGAQATSRADGNVEISYDFVASPNVTNLTIQTKEGVITIPQKLGWHYVWIEYQPGAALDGKHIIRSATDAHVEQVYYTGDFFNLGIGTG